MSIIDPKLGNQIQDILQITANKDATSNNVNLILIQRFLDRKR